MKPDYVVAKYNITHMGKISSSDMYYLTHLSLDAVVVLSDIKEDQMNEGTKEMLNNYYKRIDNDYENGVRYFNLSRYQAYKTAKSNIY